MEEADGKLLLELARKTIENSFSKKTSDKRNDNPDSKKWEKFSKKQGAFVTIYKNGQLRGCIGFPQPVYPLKEAVIEAAKAAAFEDPRFPPLREEELPWVNIEVTVLTVPEKIKVKEPSEYPEQITIGKDGLIVKSEFRSGLLLPQVFTEYNCDEEEALSMTCEKAGLEKDAWKKRDVEIYKFQGEIFSEKQKK